MRNTILSACFAVLSLAACDAGQSRRAHGILSAVEPRSLELTGETVLHLVRTLAKR